MHKILREFVLYGIILNKLLRITFVSFIKYTFINYLDIYLSM